MRQSTDPGTKENPCNPRAKSADKSQEVGRHADFRGVPAVYFAHVLDRLIDGGPGPSTTAATAGILTKPLLAAPMGRANGAFFFRGMPPPPVEHPRRRLTAAQYDALETLRRAGAKDLRADYLVAELKSAFRRLARQFHPDRHPTADAETRARLTNAFRQVRDAYRALPA